jgi:60 kDa SS-A/Ro ribonucleoprotein
VNTCRYPHGMTIGIETIASITEATTMANKSLFGSIAGTLLPKPDAVNEAGGPAYSFGAKHALAQYVATGCLNATFYANAEEQLTKVLLLSAGLEAEFVAKAAIFARERGRMKDTPALLCAILAGRDTKLLEAIFPRVIDNAKMLRNFVQIVRSGVTGRKSLGSAPKRMVLEWLAARSEEALFAASVGQQPSLGDVIKMVHPKPDAAKREALYGYLIGRSSPRDSLPELVRSYEAFKKGETSDVPKVPFALLTALPLANSHWIEIARNAPWQATRMNLNTFARHGVFGDDEVAKIVAERLRNRELIASARAFPYQLMVAYANADARVPNIIKEALQDAMEIALENVPSIAGKVYVMPDVSGSMHSAITGARGSATSVVRCIDVAALIAAAIVRRNPDAEVVPFNTKVVEVALNPRDTVMTNAAKLASLPQGGTNCSAPLAHLNERNGHGDMVIYVSDNQSWVDAANAKARGTAMMVEWNRFKARNAQARLVCIDLQPYATTQADEREDILNVGGFSDQVFETIAEFAAGKLAANHWVSMIEAIEI